MMHRYFFAIMVLLNSMVANAGVIDCFGRVDQVQYPSLKFEKDTNGAETTAFVGTNKEYELVAVEMGKMVDISITDTRNKLSITAGGPGSASLYINNFGQTPANLGFICTLSSTH